MVASDVGLDPGFKAKIDAMVAASGGKLYIVSGYRDNATQANLYAAAVKKYGQANAGNWVAPPGHSNHNKGLAVDLGGDLDLAHKLAPQFGLVFPMGWEPWHIEPVGLRETASPQAYTQGPPGTQNPTTDPGLASTPEFMSASLASALINPAEAVAIGQVPGVANPATGVAKGQVASGGSRGGGAGPVTLTPGKSGQDQRIPGHSIQDWAKDVLSGMGVPTSQTNIDTLVTWANRESGGYNPSASGGRFNPLNTTEGAVGYAGQGGSQGNIKDFSSYEQGVQAQVHNLTQTKGVGYEQIVAALRAQDPQAVFGAINNSAFGTKF